MATTAKIKFTITNDPIETKIKLNIKAEKLYVI